MCLSLAVLPTSEPIAAWFDCIHDLIGFILSNVNGHEIGINYRGELSHIIRLLRTWQWHWHSYLAHGAARLNVDSIIIITDIKMRLHLILETSWSWCSYYRQLGLLRRIFSFIYCAMIEVGDSIFVSSFISQQVGIHIGWSLGNEMITRRLEIKIGGMNIYKWEAIGKCAFHGGIFKVKLKVNDWFIINVSLSLMPY